MHGLRLLHKYFSNVCKEIHANQLSSLFDAVGGALASTKLLLASINGVVTLSHTLSFSSSVTAFE